MGDFSKDQGGTQSRPSKGREPKEQGQPHTGFDDSPAGECGPTAAGPGVGNTRRGIR